MGLHLRHRHDDVTPHDDIGEPQLPQVGETGLQRPAHERGGVEIDERGLDRAEGVEQPGPAHDVLRVAAMAGPLAHAHRCRAETPEGDHGGGHEAGVGVDGGQRVELDEVGLQEHGLPAHVGAHLAQAVGDDGLEVAVVGGGPKHRHP